MIGPLINLALSREINLRIITVAHHVTKYNPPLNIKKTNQKGGINMITNDIWDSFFEGFEDLNTKIEEMFSEIDIDGPCKVYGFTMYQGPDGVRHVREFGNKENMLTQT